MATRGVREGDYSEGERILSTGSAVARNVEQALYAGSEQVFKGLEVGAHITGHGKGRLLFYVFIPPCDCSN